jgi:hypothetical protein
VTNKQQDLDVKFDQTEGGPVYIWGGEKSHGLRLLRRSPGFALLAICCLTFGIGATTAAFSWIEGILLRPFPIIGFCAWILSIDHSACRIPREVEFIAGSKNLDLLPSPYRG